MSDRGAFQPMRKPAYFYDIVLKAVAVLLCLVSLIVRIGYRRQNLNGWEIQGPAHGLFLVSTRPLGQAISEIWDCTRHFWNWSNANSLWYTLLPTGFSAVFGPSLLWVTLFNFVLVLGSLVLATWFTGHSFRKWWLVALVWTTSSEMLSFSVMGFPSFGGMLPHALALAIVLSPCLQSQAVLSLFLGLISCEMSWHLYESGRLLFFVFFAAAILLPKIKLSTRIAWAVSGICQLASLLYFKSSATGLVPSLSDLSFQKIGAALGVFFDRLVLSPSFVLPTLFVCGTVSVFSLKKNRYFWMSLYLAQIVLLHFLALKHIAMPLGDGQFWSRRLGVLDFYLLVFILLKYRELEPTFLPIWKKRALEGVLIVGALAQCIFMFVYFRTPADINEHPLPHTHSAYDLRVSPRAVKWAEDLVSDVKSGKKIILLHNLESPLENWTDPEAVIERIYLSIGHQKFVSSIMVYGTQKCRFACLPIQDLDQYQILLSTLEKMTPRERARFEIHYVEYGLSSETKALLEQTTSRFEFDRDVIDDAFVRLRFKASQSPFCR